MNRTGYQLLAALLPWVERYEAQGGTPALGEFLAWLRHQTLGPQKDAPAPAPPVAASEAGAPPLPIASRAFQHIVQLFRRLKHETKAASEGLPMNHLDEFVMLMIVMDMPGVRKSDLVAMNRMETSSGNDMVNRLIRAGWLSEAREGRYRRLYITEQGRELGYELARRYNTVSATILGPLQPEQVAQLVQLLRVIDPDDTAY